VLVIKYHFIFINIISFTENTPIYFYVPLLIWKCQMLYVLQNLKAINCVVIVTRWFGGIELGPDRFKHISNQTKEVLLIYLNGRFHKRSTRPSSPKFRSG
jgi:hypothetical protein